MRDNQNAVQAGVNVSGTCELYSQIQKSGYILQAGNTRDSDSPTGNQ